MKSSSLDPRKAPPLDDDGAPEVFPLEVPGIGPAAADASCNATSCQDDGPEVFPPELLDRTSRETKEKDKAKRHSSKPTNEGEATQEHTIDDDTVIVQKIGNLGLFHPPGVMVGSPERAIDTDDVEPMTVHQLHRRPGAEYVPNSSRTAPVHHPGRRADLLGGRQHDSTHLVSASLVLPMDTVEAKPAPRFRSRKYQWIGGIAIILIISIITIAVAVILSRPDPSNLNPTFAPTRISADMVLMEILDPVLPESSKDAIFQINTPQYFAFQWLLSKHDGSEGYSDDRIRQRYALATIYYATNGRGWYDTTGWLEDTDECNWYFSTYYSCESYSYDEGHCDMLPLKNASVCKGGVLKILHLDSNLQGSLPPDICILSDLTYLRLGNYGLSGPLPTDIGKMTNLIFLDLQWDQTGSIPSFIGQLTNLEYLQLLDSLLTGLIPIDIGKLTNLELLILSNNGLTGPIPSFINQLTNLAYLDLSSAVLTGSIPTSLGELTNLVELTLWSNRLTGPIPSSIGHLENLAYLDLSMNSLTGSIPLSIGQLTNLESLVLYVNELNGTIPSTVGQLTNLEFFDLGSNFLTGSIPSSITNLTNLRSLYVNNATLEGSIPSSLSRLTSLERISVFVKHRFDRIHSVGSLRFVEFNDDNGELWQGYMRL